MTFYSYCAAWYVLDILIHRNNDAITIEIYRKPTEIGTVIHLTSNHPFEHKISAFLYYINRLTTLPITEKSKQKEWGTILTIAKNNGYLPALIHQLKTKLTNRKIALKQNCTQQQQQGTRTLRNKWVTFTYFSPLVRKISNLFRQTDLKIAFRTTNTIQQQLNAKQTHDDQSGIYELKCKTCNKIYFGQSGRAIGVRFKENMRHIRSNNSTSAYAAHILGNRHEYGTKEDTLKLIKKCQKRKHMDCWEALYMQTLQQKKVLINEQQIGDTNPLFEIARTFSTRLYTKQQCILHFPHVYTQYHNTVLTFLSHVGRKHKHVPQLHQTEKADRNFGFENATSLPECLSQCVNEKLGCLGRCKILYQMHAAQLFTAPYSTNAQQTSCRLCGNNYKINDI